jgi:hypothetical protein
MKIIDHDNVSKTSSSMEIAGSLPVYLQTCLQKAYWVGIRDII